MTVVEHWRERRQRRKAAIRKVIFGDSPPPSRLERMLIVLSVVAGAFTCYYFRLIHAATFEVIAIASLMCYFVLRRMWWSRKMARQ